MSGIRDFVKSNDTSTKQLVFFYELAKLGVIRFDLTNPTHAKILEGFIDIVTSYDESKYENESEITKLEKANRHKLYYLIVIQLLSHIIVDLKKEGILPENLNK